MKIYQINLQKGEFVTGFVTAMCYNASVKMVFWETVTEKEEVRIRDRGILKWKHGRIPHSQHSSTEKYLPFDLHQSEKRERTAEESEGLGRKPKIKIV